MKVKFGLQFGRLGLIWVMLAYTCLFILVMGANPFRGETLAPVEMLSKYSGWHSHNFLSPSSHPERSDIIDGVLPTWITLKQMIREGEAGFWNPMRANGNPGVLLLSGAKLTPSYLVFLAIDENWLGFYFSGLLKLVIAATGGFLFLRLFITTYPALFGGAVFALSGFNAAWFYWPHVSTSAWIPWVLWTCAGWYIFRRRRWLLGIVATTVMLLLGGFPAVAAYGLGAVVLLAIVLSFSYQERYLDAVRNLGIVLAAIAIGFLLAAIPLLALAELIGLIDLGYRHGGTRLHFPGDLMLLIDPFAHGIPIVEKTFFTGWVAIILAFIVPAWMRYKGYAIHSVVLVWYGLILFACSFAAIFGLIPQSLLKTIPVVGSSPWSRFSVIIGMAIAILAAVALENIMARVGKYGRGQIKALAIFGIGIIAGYQLYDQATLFREFNNVAKASDFFPPTPAIEHVKENLGVTQSIIADDGFFIPGALGAYGIPEWFAHGFRSETEKATLRQLVNNPFKTATAARFGANSINLDGDLYARLGIRYVLMTHHKYKLLRRQPPTESLAMPPIPQNRLAQIIRTETPLSLSAIAIGFDMNRTERAETDVILQLTDSRGKVLVRSIVEAGDIKSGRRTIFRFDENIDLPAGSYELHLDPGKKIGNQQITVKYSSRAFNDGDMIRVNKNRMPGAIHYTFYGNSPSPSTEPDWWRPIQLPEDRISMLENLRTPKGAYLVHELTSNSPWTADKIITNRLGAEKLHVSYSGNDSGFVIIPIRSYPGWNFYVNGSKSLAQTYLGMMPAVWVDGPAEIEYTYEPGYIAKGGMLMVSAAPLLLFLLYFSGKVRHKKLNGVEQNT